MTLMMKTATAIVAFTMIVVVLLLVAGWIALVMMGILSIWVGVTTITANWELAMVDIVVGMVGLAVATLIALLYTGAAFWEW